VSFIPLSFGNLLLYWQCYDNILSVIILLQLLLMLMKWLDTG